jgi:hypothetical protein
MGVNGAPDTDDVFMLVDYWVNHLSQAFETVAGNQESK